LLASKLRMILLLALLLLSGWYKEGWLEALLIEEVIDEIFR